MKKLLLLLALVVSCGENTLMDANTLQWNEAKKAYESSASESWDIQPKVDARIPNGLLFSWMKPTQYTSFGGFWSYDIHEGVDYINTSSTTNIPVVASVDGEVVYVRIGCPQSTEGNNWKKNESGRLCGGGWGNHIVLKHTSQGNVVYSRYAHLKPYKIIVGVGDYVVQGQQIATMGNSGSSNVRHLHFEMGIRSAAFDPKKGNQNLTKVYNPEKLTYKNFVLVDPNLPPREGKLVATATPFTWIKKSMEQASDLPDSQKCQMINGGALFYKDLVKVGDNYYRVTQNSASGVCPHFKVGDTIYLYIPHFRFTAR